MKHSVKQVRSYLGAGSMLVGQRRGALEMKLILDTKLDKYEFGTGNNRCALMI